MSAILYLPGLLVILFKRHGLFATIRHMLVLACTQTLLARSFLMANAKSYLQNAFDLSRVFLYKWTVNWRFVDERTFLSPAWAKGLLLGHVTVLIAFGLFRWSRGDGGVARVLQRGLRRPGRPAGLAPVDPDCESFILGVRQFLFANLHTRCCYCAYDFQSHRDHLCAITALPILLVVFAAIASSYSKNEVSFYHAVSLFAQERVFLRSNMCKEWHS
jgi:alpha-1,3-mannosyltransferase